MPPRACLGCSRNAAIPGTSRCKDCTRSGWQLRPPPGANVNYRGSWPRIAAAVMAEEKRCRLCGSQENLEADHIIPLSLGGTHERRNVRALCRRCHGRITARQGHEAQRRKRSR
jgi:5-methylcytosine-specific restriction endonuclease McrA